MLEGLEISEVNFYNLKQVDTLRLDSDYFQKKYLNLQALIKRKKNHFVSFNDCELTIDASAFYPSLEPYYNTGNIPFVRVADVDNFIDYDNCVRIPNEVLNAPSFNTLKSISKGDIVITKGGSVGRVALVERLTAVTRDLIFVNSSKLKKEDYIFLYLYLKSDFAYSLMIQSSSMTAQPHLTLTLIKDLPLFKASINLKKQIELLYDKTILFREHSQSLYSQAEELLLDELGLKDWQPSTENINEKSFFESFLSTGRLDAEYYQPKYEDYEAKIREYSKGSVCIKEEYEHIKDSFVRNKDGFNYIEIGNVNISDGSCTSNYVLTEDLPANAKIKVERGDLLISTVRPYRGAVSIIDIEDTDLVVSGAFTVLRKSPTSLFSNEVLKVLLRTNIYKDWLLQFNVGTQYPVIKDEDILNLSIPLLSEEIQLKVNELVQESFKLKRQSEYLLEVAKRAVEIAIEQNEEVATEYINENIEI